MSRQYERLSIEDFGAHLLDTGDLDPIYIALHKMELDIVKLSRWLVAYWCFYHAGAASHMADRVGDDAFWNAMQIAALNNTPTPTGGRWPRGHERRHFRGQQGIDAVMSLQHRHRTPIQWLNSLGVNQLWAERVQFSAISELVQQERGFGPWISFKVGDMLDRLDLLDVNFDQAEVFMFKDPVEAAMRLWRLKGGFSENAMPKDKVGTITQIVDYLRMVFKDHQAPPLYDRAVGLQEIETILCKWKSHMNGHYPLQNDTIEIRQGLSEWAPHSPTAALMIECMPRVLT